MAGVSFAFFLLLFFVLISIVDVKIFHSPEFGSWEQMLHTLCFVIVQAGACATRAVKKLSG